MIFVLNSFSRTYFLKESKIKLLVGGLCNTHIHPEGEIGLLFDRLLIRQLLTQINRLVDVTLSFLSFVCAYYIKKYYLPYPLGGLSETPDYVILGLLIIIIWFGILFFININVPVCKKFSKLFINIIQAVTTGLIILILVLYVFKIRDISRIMLGTFYFLNIIVLTLYKSILLWFLKKSGKSIYKKWNILVIGSKERAIGAISLLHSIKDHFTIVGCLDTNRESIGMQVKEGVKVIGVIDDIQTIITNEVIDEVIFAMPMNKIDRCQAYIQLIELMGIRVRIFPDWHIHSLLYEPRVASIYFDELNGVPSMVLSSTPTRNRELLMKQFLDYFTSGLLLFFSLPIFIIAALLIKISSKGPVFFKQERIGLNGRRFTLYKFRTMVNNAEEQLVKMKDLNEADGPVFKIRNDPRIIPFIGTLLRKTSLDELPQLINVIKGQMSLIGPRPPLHSEVKEYDIWHRRRLSMKPGITCLWQMQPNRNDLSFEQWMDLDLEYIDNWSLKVDLMIFFRTIAVMVLGYGR
jgi:exopolysaccharide biosynthesis polyprenyl glycosylphosphotransferase